MFITYSKTFLNNLDKKNQESFAFYSEIEELLHILLRKVITFNVTFRGALTSHAGVITSTSSKYMVSGYQPGGADNLRAGNIVSHIQTLGYRG